MAQAYYGGTSMSAQTIFQQRSLVNAFMEARANFGSGGGDTFAALHADVQAQNSYISAARQAMTWVPVLNLVLTIVFYAMFPVVFPLFLFPQTGPALLKGYLTGFFYLASWGPIYAVLHMFITQYSAAQLSALAPTGMTMATMAGIDSVNQNMETLAGYLLMFVPVMAAGMAKGAMSIASNTTAMLAPAMHAAEAAAVERTTGNYAYGNSQFQNVTGHQVNTAPTWNVAASPIPQVNMRGDNGTITSTMADGSTVYNTSGAISRFGFSASEMQSVTGNLQQTGAQYHSRANAERETSAERWSHGMRTLDSLSSGMRRASGSEGASGGQGGNTTTLSDRQGIDSKQQTGNRTIGESLTSGRSLGHAETNTFGINAGIKAGVGGKVLGADVGLRRWLLGSQMDQDHRRSGSPWHQRQPQPEPGQQCCPLPCQRAGHHAHRWRLLARWHLPPGREFRRKAPRHRARFLRGAIAGAAGYPLRRGRLAPRTHGLALAQQRLPDLRRHEPGHCLALCRNGRKPRVPRSGRALAHQHHTIPPSARSPQHDRRAHSGAICSRGLGAGSGGLGGSGCDDGGVPAPAEFSMPQATPRPQGRRSAGSAARHAPQNPGVGSGTVHHAPGDDAARAAIQRGAAEVTREDAAAQETFQQKAAERAPQNAGIKRDVDEKP
jgi:conjugal transfer mating pair stabilization protein TraG